MIGLLASIKSGITTLTGRLTSTRAGYLDNLDAAMSTRLGSIKTVQRGTITVTISSGTGSNTATITSVTTSKSIVYLLGHTPAASPSGIYTARIALTNGTTVTANATGSVDTTVTVGYQVIEFN